MLPTTSSTASTDILVLPPMSLVFFFQSSSSPAFLTSLLTQSSYLSLGLPRLLLPSSRNSAALFGSLSCAILSTCPAHCSLLLTILLLSALFTLAIFLPSLLLLFFIHSCFRALATFVVFQSVPKFPFRTGMPVSQELPCPLVFLRFTGPPSPSQLLSTRSLRPVLFEVPLSVFPSPRTVPPRYIKLSP